MLRPCMRHASLSVKSEVEQASHNDEEAEEGQLEEQADDDDFLARVEEFKAPGCLDATTTHLYNEADYISRYEDLCEPLLAEDGVFLAIDKEDDATEDYVYRCGEQGGRKEKQ
jgi:hypothetical protein